MRRKNEHAGEISAVWLVALAFFCVLAAYYVIRPVRDQLAGATGSVALPWFYAGILVATLAITPVFGWLGEPLISPWVRTIVRRAGASRRAPLGVGFFIWVSVFNLFVASLFWSLMADLFDGERAKLVFPLIVLGGTFGALAGPTLTSLLVWRIGGVVVTSGLDGLRALGATLGVIGGLSAAVAGLAGWLGWRAAVASRAASVDVAGACGQSFQ